MNSKNTRIWFVIAAALFAFIYFFERELHPGVVPPAPVLPDLQPSAVTSVGIIPIDAPRIRADKTNGTWYVTRPILYPAQFTAVETLLDALQQLKPVQQISAAELRANRGANAEYGFDRPQTSLAIEAGDQSWQINLGNRTAPGDQIYLQVVGKAAAYVVDAGWLKYIPKSANEWRDTDLIKINPGSTDWIVLTNNSKGVVIELRRDATNHLWRITRPLPARADGTRITEALQNLEAARISQFVSDDSKADLTSYGLEPASIDLWAGGALNLVAGLHFGKSLVSDPSQLYVRRDGWISIVATPQDRLSPWWGGVNSFRDPYLLELTAPVAEIDLTGPANFILQRGDATNSDWHIVGEKFPVDAENVQQLIELLAGLRVAEFVKDVVTTNDLPFYGLSSPVRQVTIRSSVNDSNSMAQLRFGATQNGEVYVRLSDEEFVYAVATNDFTRLPDSSWEFRARHIWDFSENDISKVTVSQLGKVRQMIRSGTNGWALAPGSQGIINNPPAIEETMHRLGQLTVAGWVGRNMGTNSGRYGFRAENLSITIDLKNGTQKKVDFGDELPGYQTALAAVMLDGERWPFIFPPVLYQFVTTYLAIPASAP